MAVSYWSLSHVINHICGDITVVGSFQSCDTVTSDLQSVTYKLNFKGLNNVMSILGNEFRGIYIGVFPPVTANHILEGRGHSSMIFLDLQLSLEVT